VVALEPRVRMGIHTGECDYAEGDYLGVAVNQAARVSATAHGGQIVTSHVVAILAGTITISAWLPAACQRAGP
jgi:class 3 adenylate cyclase